MEKLVRESSAQGHRSMVLVQYLFSCYHRPSAWTVELQLRRNASRRTAREVRRCRRRRQTGLPIARRGRRRRCWFKRAKATTAGQRSLSTMPECLCTNTHDALPSRRPFKFSETG